MSLQRYTLQTLVIFILSFFFFHFVFPSNFSYPAAFNFGDSNSDTGGLVAGVAFPIGPPNGLTYFNQPSGRFCDVDSMDHQFLNPYLDSVGAPDFRQGCNFATGGATLLPANAASTNPFSFGIQISQFIRFKARALQLLAKDKKFQRYLPQENYFNQGVYMFDLGQNDLDGAFYSKSEEQVVASIPNMLSEFESGMERLYNGGARNFWIHNTGPLGCLPRIISIFGKNASSLDQLGCVNSHNRAAKEFNARLLDLCAEFRAHFSDANVTYVDIFSIKSNLIANFSEFGFKQALAACCGYGGLPLNYDSRIACGQTKNLNGSTVTANPCNNTAEYVNWDGNHYTEPANRYISELILSGNYFDSPVFVNNPFTTKSKSSSYKMLLY
ncbi:GDSL esterase/lipase At1g54790-like isoform X2 [Euphorbia lathyris]|uniref:GDSL esterase/lipase At1g54790-like isoform X2 n=1 Tax=Euphorbia lathyris TaxID=212925 RepID=UPI0033133AAF